MLTQDGTKRNPGAGRNGFSLPSRAAPGGLCPSPRRSRCPPPWQRNTAAAPRPGEGSPPPGRARPAPTSSCGLPARRCGAVRGRGRLHGASGRAAGAAPLASPRGQPRGAGMAAALPSVREAQGEGKRKEVNRIPRQEAFPRPSLGCGSSLLPAVNAEAASALLPPPFSRRGHKGKLRCFLLLPRKRRSTSRG